MDAQLDSARDWSSLPSDILSMLLNHLDDTETDCRRLRSVCASWRSSIIPPTSPLKFPIEIMLPFPSIESIMSDISGFPDNIEERYESGMLMQSIFYLISSPAESSSTSSVWLTRVQEKPIPRNAYGLLNPLTPVPEFGFAAELKVSFLDYRCSEVARSYGLHGYFNLPKSKKTVMLPKVGATADNFYLLAKWKAKELGLFIAGADEWVNPGSGIFDDIIAYQGIFYATDFKGWLISIDPKTMKAQDLGWDEGNCIFFTQEGFLEYYEWFDEDEGLEGLTYYDGNIDLFSKYCGVYFLEDERIITRDSLPSQYTKTFWPVPRWFSNNATLC